jgi:hypothetical protein
MHELVYKIQLIGKKVGKQDARMEESTCWKWVITSKVKNTYQNNVCK